MAVYCTLFTIIDFLFNFVCIILKFYYCYPDILVKAIKFIRFILRDIRFAIKIVTKRAVH